MCGLGSFVGIELSGESSVANALFASKTRHFAEQGQTARRALQV